MANEPGYMLTVPNDEEGRHFMVLFKKYLNRKVYGYRKRGRHSDRKGLEKKLGGRLNFTRDVPMNHAEEWKIYIDAKYTDGENSKSINAFRVDLGWKARAQHSLDVQRKGIMEELAVNIYRDLLSVTKASEIDLSLVNHLVKLYAIKYLNLEA